VGSDIAIREFESVAGVIDLFSLSHTFVLILTSVFTGFSCLLIDHYH
jgi:hypothetical protein